MVLSFIVVAVATLVIAAAAMHAPAGKPADETLDPAKDRPGTDQPADDMKDQPAGGADGGDTGGQPTNSSNGYDEDRTIYFFYGDGCSHCVLIEPYVHEIAAKYPQFKLVEMEVWYNGTNQALFQELNQRYGVTDPLVPAVFLADKAMIAEGAIQENLEPTIQRMIASGYTIAPPPASA